MKIHRQHMFHSSAAAQKSQDHVTHCLLFTIEMNTTQSVNTFKSNIGDPRGLLGKRHANCGLEISSSHASVSACIFNESTVSQRVRKTWNIDDILWDIMNGRGWFCFAFDICWVWMWVQTPTIVVFLSASTKFEYGASNRPRQLPSIPFSVHNSPAITLPFNSKQPQ